MLCCRPISKLSLTLALYLICLCTCSALCKHPTPPLPPLFTYPLAPSHSPQLSSAVSSQDVLPGLTMLDCVLHGTNASHCHEFPASRSHPFHLCIPSDCYNSIHPGAHPLSGIPPDPKTWGTKCMSQLQALKGFLSHARGNQVRE